MDMTESTRSSRIAFLGAGAGMAPGILIAAALYNRSAEVVWGILLIPMGYIGGIWLALARAGYIRAGFTTAAATIGYLVTVVGIVSSGWLNDRQFPILVGGGAWLALAGLSAYVSGALVPGGVIKTRDELQAVHPGPRSLALDIVALTGGSVAGALTGALVGFGGGFLLLMGGAFGMGLVVGTLWLMILGALLGAVVGMGIVIRKQTIRR